MCNGYISHNLDMGNYIDWLNSFILAIADKVYIT